MTVTTFVALVWIEISINLLAMTLAIVVLVMIIKERIAENTWLKD